MSVEYTGRHFTDYTDTEGWYQLIGLPEAQQITLNVDVTGFRAKEFELVCDGDGDGDGDTFDIQLSQKDR